MERIERMLSFLLCLLKLGLHDRGEPNTSDSPADHSEEDIARSLESYWPVRLREEYDLHKRYKGVEDVEDFTGTEIEVIEVQKLSDHTARALVQTRVDFADLSVWARTFLLGTRVDLAQHVEAARRRFMGGILPSNQMLIYSKFEDGQWALARLEEEEWEAQEELYNAHLVIGESVQLLTDWKEPPFAMAVLGPPKAANGTMLQIPVRITSILPRWAYVGGPPTGTMTTAPDEHGGYSTWTSIRHNSDLPLPSDTFEGVVLVKGGSHDGFIYFWPEEECDESAQVHQFVKLEFLDAAEATIEVDLTRNVSPEERVRFENGAPVNPALIAGVGPRLKGSGWSDSEYLPMAGIGDTITVDDEPSYDLTVLGPPEPVGDSTLRVRLRVTNRQEEEVDYNYLHAQLTTLPDTFGRIRNLWRAAPSREDLPDSFVEVTLRPGETHEAYVYFLAPEGENAPPEEPFTTLWCGDLFLERPIDLTGGR